MNQQPFSEDEIRVRAYIISRTPGMSTGSPDSDWYEAIRQLEQERSLTQLTGMQKVVYWLNQPIKFGIITSWLDQPLIWVEKKVAEPIDNWLGRAAIIQIFQKLSPIFEAVGVIAIPIVIWWFTQSAEEDKERQEAALRQQETRIRAQQVVKDYLNQLTTILLEGEIGKDETLRTITRATTLAVLSDPAIDGSRKGQVIEYLSESGLIRKGEPIIPLSGSDLRDAYFVRANLPNVSFSDADLENANFSSANLSGADLSDANLLKANLNNTDLSNANLNSANLFQAKLESTDLSNANLSDARLISAKLRRANLSNVNFSGANFGSLVSMGYDDPNDPNSISVDVTNRTILSESNLSGANLTQTNLQNADLHKANLNGANLSDADLSHDYFIDLRRINRYDADPNNVSFFYLEGVDLSGADLSNANLSGANLSGVNLKGATVSIKQLNQAKLCETKLPEDIDLDPNRNCQELLEQSKKNDGE